MRHRACTWIPILLALPFCVPYDFKPYMSDELNRQKVSRKVSEMCFIHNKPFLCSIASSAMTASNEWHKSNLYLTPARLPVSYPSTTSVSHKRTLDNVLQRPPINYSPPKFAQSSIYYPSHRELHENLLYNSPPLDHAKYNYEITTMVNTIRHLLDDSMLPSRDKVIYVNQPTTERLFAAVSKTFKENETAINVQLFDKFTRSLDRFDRNFYQTTFNKLLSISPSSRRENGISFAQSGLFLYLAVMALSTEVDLASSAEIDANIGFQALHPEKIRILRLIASWLPMSNHDLKFRWTTRVVLEPGLPVSQEFMEGTATALNLHVEWLNGTESLANITNTLNSRVKSDSGGAMRNTFEEEDFTEGACTILLNTIYIRARWRSSPTVLNGSWPFRDTKYAPERSVRMIRINDIMRYAFLKDWRAEALEIKYATPDLSLLLLIPEGHSLKNLATNMAKTSLRKIYNKMRSIRVAAILPIYTLRMTLLLPGKLQAMGISRLVNANYTKSSGCGKLRLSHGVQRIMFWAEAGRNAFKDDGIEWDEAPKKEITVDRPYLFYVRWKNVTLLNGNFVL